MNCDKCKINIANSSKKLIIGKKISSTVHLDGQSKVYTTKYQMVESITSYYCEKCFIKYYIKRAIFSISIILLSLILFQLNFHAENIVINLSGFLKFIFEIYTGLTGYILTFIIFFIALFRFHIEDSRVFFCKKLLREQGKLPFFLGYKIHVFTEKQWDSLKITSF